MEKIPQHPMVFNTGTKTYKIQHEKLKNEYGCVLWHEGVIKIDPNQTLSDYKNTLLHEIIHVGLDMFGLGEGYPFSKANNEFVTTICANMILLLKSLNKELFEFILGDD